MKKSRFFTLSLLVFLMCILMSAGVSARKNYLINEDFENGIDDFIVTNLTGTITEAKDSNGGKALQFTQGKNYASVGKAVVLERDVKYYYSYDIKPVSFNNGKEYSGISAVASVGDFLFTDSKSSNKNHHVTSTSKHPIDGSWSTVSGTYTIKTSAVASDADLDNAMFGIYTNPSSNTGHTFLIDNVKLYTVDDEPEDGENYFTNGSFEDLENIELISVTSTNVTLTPGNIDASDGIYSLKVTSNTGYGHAGIKMKLEEGRTYEFSYDLKILTDNKGNKVTSDVTVYTNFMFSDSKAASSKNHLVTMGNASTDDGWQHFSGTYTVNSELYADDATPENAKFCIYTNPFKNTGTVWLIDNLVLKRVPDGAPVAELELPALISDNMLTQKGEPIHLWGSSSYESIDVVLYDGETAVVSQTLAVKDGKFDGYLSAVNDYYNNLTLVITSGEKALATVKNVAVGELWHFGGQSNMTFTVEKCGTYKDEIMPEEDLPDIRYFSASSDGNGKWKTATLDNIPSMAAVPFTTMETIYHGLNDKAPVGGINTSVGGKKMSDFTGPCEYSANGGDLYISRVKPITNVSVKGHFWYQGTSDATTGDFVDRFEALVGSYRTAWNNADMPFIMVQNTQSAATVPDWYASLDADGNPTKSVTYDCTLVRFRQFNAFKLMKNNGVSMVVTVDTNTHIDELKSIENKDAQDPLHTWNKKPIGQRLGNTALNEVYGKYEIKHLSPYPVKATVYGNKVLVSFEGAYEGLKTDDGDTPRFFELGDENGTYASADSITMLTPDMMLLSAEKIATPDRICYFYENHFVDMSKEFTGLDVNLVNSENLPAAPFQLRELTSASADAPHIEVSAYSAAVLGGKNGMILIAAGYEGNRIVSVKKTTLQGSEVGVSFGELLSAEEIRLFLFDGNSLKPVCTPVVVNP